MQMLSLSAPSQNDTREIEAFEFANRAYFEANINARPAAFYLPGGVEAAIATAQQDALDDRAYQFLVRDQQDQLVARVNLTRVRRAHFHSAELGYRVAQAHGGLGYASRAVGLVLDKAFGELRLLRVEATARPENEASVKVLLRNGFSQFGRATRCFQLDGVWHDLLHFERHAT
jgi:ribosomal-protein-alanine N-acetyltransferase